MSLINFIGNQLNKTNIHIDDVINTLLSKYCTEEEILEVIDIMKKKKKEQQKTCVHDLVEDSSSIFSGTVRCIKCNLSYFCNTCFYKISDVSDVVRFDYTEKVCKNCNEKVREYRCSVCKRENCCVFELCSC